MAHRVYLIAVLVSVGLFSPTFEIWAHTGRLDSYGCHTDPKKADYHCHEGPFIGRGFSSREQMLRTVPDQTRTGPSETFPIIPPQLSHQQFSGKVTKVIAGDLITVVHAGQAKIIRLNGIACPNPGQPFSKEARQYTSFMLMGKVITIAVLGGDHQKTTPGEVILGDGRRLSHELLREGLAWWDRKNSREGQLEDLETLARAARRGLWTDSDPIAPWEWPAPTQRKRKS